MIEQENQGVPPPGSGYQPSASAASRLRKVVSLTRDYLLHMWRRLVPLLLCLVGAAIWKLQEGWTGSWALFFAVLSFGFAIDLAASRAEAKATKDAGLRFYAMVMDDRKTEITVTNRHTYHAATADIGVLADLVADRLAQGMPPEGPRREGGSGASAPASPVRKDALNG